MTTEAEQTENRHAILRNWEVFQRLERPPGGDFRIWLQWAVAQFPALYDAPHPLTLADCVLSDPKSLDDAGRSRMVGPTLERWRRDFGKWALTASPTMREICKFLLRFSNPSGRDTLPSGDYNLHLALVNMDSNNRRGMGKVIMHARVY